MQELKITVCGACGRMGRETVITVDREENLRLAGAVDIKNEGEDIGLLVQNVPANVKVSSSLEEVLAAEKMDVVIDFTGPFTVMRNVETALKNGVPPVVGTTGLTELDLKQVEEWTQKYSTGAIVAPNFALGAILMMKFARLASRYFSRAEIIELHHDRKIDAPSGTALKTLDLIRAGKREGEFPPYSPAGATRELEKLPGARGGAVDGIHLHSIRLPGLVAHQEVIFGGEGQTLTLRHDSFDRGSFMPGLIMAVKRAPSVKGLIYGMENLIEF